MKDFNTEAIKIMNEKLCSLKSVYGELQKWKAEEERAKNRTDGKATFSREFISQKINECVAVYKQFHEEMTHAFDDFYKKGLKEIADSEVINSDEITEDAKLFTCGVELSAKDIESIYERNVGNRTMQILTERYAREHNMKGLYFGNPSHEMMEDLKGIYSNMQVLSNRAININDCDVAQRVFERAYGEQIAQIIEAEKNSASN